MSTSAQQLRKTCTTHTNPGLDNPFRLMLPICHSGFSLPSQPIPHKHTLQLHWPLRTQKPKGSTTKSSCSVPTLQNRIQKMSLPHGNHLLSLVITRPHTTRFSGACICRLISYFQKAMLFLFVANIIFFLHYHRLFVLYYNLHLVWPSIHKICPYKMHRFCLKYGLWIK